MKKTIQLAILLVISSISISQTQLKLKINHKLGAVPFALNTQVTSNEGDVFNINRMEYYLTIISITHDGGMVTPINKVVLVNAANPIIESLATVNVTTLESVTMATGVDPALNHLDPSLYASTHPLAPKSPSMHWGWTPGYRFIAMEGRTFPVNPSLVYELHSLGSISYFYTTINTAGVAGTGELTIELNADYIEGLNGIDLSNGPIYHGELKDNKRHLENFRDDVFTSVEGNQSVGISKQNIENVDFNISPNPTKEGENLTISFTQKHENLTVVVIDMEGKIVFEQNISSSRIKLNNLSEGIYICSVKNQDHQTIGSRKFVVTK